jgi:hypothetical protein
MCERNPTLSGAEEHRGTEKMSRGPLDKSVCVIGDRSGRRTIDMLEDGIEHRASVLDQIGHERAELFVEIAEKQQILFVQNRKA